MTSTLSIPPRRAFSLIEVVLAFGIVSSALTVVVGLLPVETTDTNNPAEFEDDLNKLKSKSAEKHINYRIFDTELIIPASK